MKKAGMILSRHDSVTTRTALLRVRVCTEDCVRNGGLAQLAPPADDGRNKRRDC
jgi:hypothetical protein